MNKWKCSSFLLILAVGQITAESLKKSAEIAAIQFTNGEVQSDTGLDYETALRPAVLQKRSIANIARLLLGGNVPANHPLVKYPEPKTWNLANNIVASLPGSSLTASASDPSGGWAPNPNSAMANLQQLFETKAKLIPYTGQVAQGITGLASVKGDLLRQIHTISTQAIAQAAAEAAARALASAAAAHAVTNSIGHSANAGAQTGIKGGWSSYQNNYQPAYNSPQSAYDKTPGDMPGPPYPSSSAHINHYQAPPSFNSNPFSMPVTTPPPPSVAYNPQPQPYQNGYYTLYNSQQQTSSAQTPYTPAPPVAHARPTLSPSTLIATTPSGYSPSLSQPITPNMNNNSSSISIDITIDNSNSNSDSIDNNSNSSRSPYGRNFDVASPVTLVTSSSSNNTPLPSFRRTVPAGIFWRNAAQPSSTSSLLSTISSLLSASTAAYNSAFTGAGPNHHHQHYQNRQQHNPPAHQHQSPALFSNILSSASSQIPAAAPSLLSPSSPIASPSTVLGTGISSAANIYANNGYQQQSANPVPQGGSYNGGSVSSGSPGYLYQQPGNPGNHFGASETRPTAVHAPSYSFNQHVPGHAGANYPQSGANSYIANAIQSSPQFSGGQYGAVPAASTGSASVSGVPGTGYGAASYSAAGAGPGSNGPVPAGSGYSGFNGGTGPSNGHVGGWNTQHAGPSPSASAWNSAPANVHPSGYAGQATGNFNNPSGGFGGPSTQFPVAAGSAPIQQAYPTVPQNAYQSPAPGAYAQAQPPVPTQPQQNQFRNNNGYQQQQQQQQQQYQSPPSTNNGVGGLRNSNLNYNSNNNNYNYQRHDSHDQNQSASTMGSEQDYDDNDYDDDHHHSYQQAQRRNRPERPSKNSYSSSRYPSPSKKRPPPKRPSSNGPSSYNSGKKPSHYRGDLRNKEQQTSYNSNNGENNDKRVIPSGSKKGSHFASSVDVVDINYSHSREGGDQFYDSEENGNTDKNRWRPKNSSGQRTDSFHNHNSNGRWSGKASNTKQTSSKNVRGHVQGSERTRPQPGRATGKSERHKKVPTLTNEKQHKLQQQQKSKTKPKTATAAANIHGGGQQWKQQQPTVYKSRDVYTTLPEYVFRVGERTDVFLRPSRKRKHRNRVWGRLSPRFGETPGSGGGSSPISTTDTKDDMETAYTSYIQSLSKELFAEENLEKSSNADPTRSLASTTPARRKDEKFVVAGAAADETARKDVLSDDGFPTASEEFDPEEREAFIDDVYADDADRSNKRRHDYPVEDEQGSVQTADYNEDDVIDK